MAVLPGGSLFTGCATGREFDKSVGEITASYRFSLLNWEMNAFGEAMRKTFTDRGSEDGTLERTIELQIEEALAEQGIFHPAYRYVGIKTVLPPVNFRLEKPPHLLVVSPRDRIEEIKTVLLQQRMSVEEMETIEAEVAKLGYSSLVTEIGGVATYPSFVSDDASLSFIIESAVEEWLHQYLVFKPLGFLYMLDTAGLRPDYEIVTMNESCAGIFRRELGDIIYQRHYAQDEANDAAPAAAPEFDFDAEMRNTRQTVDAYLDQGEIETAETYMERKRRYLEIHGYHIRKLNQAYFAFHGTYADRPAFLSPIGADLEELRSRSDSLKDFLETAAAMTSREELADSVK